MEESYSLAQILRRHHGAFIDSSALFTSSSSSSLFNRKPLNEHITRANSASNLDLSQIMEYGSFLIQRGELFKEYGAKFTPEVISESKRYQGVIDNSIKIFTRGGYNILIANSKFKNKKLRKENGKRNMGNRREAFPVPFELKFLKKSFDSVGEAIKENEWVSIDSNYEIFSDLVEIVSDYGNLKMKSNLDVDSDTNNNDERLVAAVFYEALISGETQTIITRDYDLVRMVSKVPRMIGATGFGELNSFFGGRFNPFPINLYYAFKDAPTEFKLLEKSGKNNKFGRRFIIRGISKEKNIQVRNEVGNLWKRFKGNLSEDVQAKAS